MVWGPEVFEALRGISSPALDRIAKILTDLGSAEFYTSVVPIVYWCVSKSLGFSLGVATVLSGAVNSAIKDVFRVPRPHMLYPHLGAPQFLLDTGPGWSFPSGHTQNTAMFWSYLAMRTKAKWALTAAVILTVVVGFTRVYATVHSPTDVIAGALIGITLAAVFTGVERSRRRTRPAGTGALVAVGIVVPAGVLALASVLGSSVATHELAPLMGFAAGAIVGRRIEELHIGYREQAPIGAQVVKAIAGVAGILALRYGLKAVFPSGNAFTMVRYACIALWVTAGAPWVFKAVMGGVAGGADDAADGGARSDRGATARARVSPRARRQSLENWKNRRRQSGRKPRKRS